MTIWYKDTDLFAGTDCPETLEAAKEYIAANALTKEDVMLFRQAGIITIRARRDVL